MKFIVLLSVSVGIFLSQTLWAYTGRDIIEEAKTRIENINKRNSPETIKTRIKMNIHEGKKVTEKEFDIMAKRFKSDEGKVLISYTRPSKMKFLIHTHRNEDRDIWMRMSSGKVRKVFMDEGKPLPILSDTHFNFEEFNARFLDNPGFDLNNMGFSITNLDDYDFKYIGEIKAAGYHCFKVEAIPKEMDLISNKAIYYFRKSDFFITRIDFYKNDKFHRYLELQDLRKVDKILMPFRSVMYMANKKGKTELMVQSIKFNVKISKSKFKKDALR